MRVTTTRIAIQAEQDEPFGSPLLPHISSGFGLFRTAGTIRILVTLEMDLPLFV